VGKYAYQDSMAIQQEYEQIDYVEQEKREKQEAINLNKNDIYDIKEEDFEDNE
jgi:hypothetical protein